MIAQETRFEVFEEPVENQDGLQLRGVEPESGKLVAAAIGVTACARGEECGKN